MRSCGHQIRQQLVARVLFCVWDVGCATANRRLHFNQLTNRSVWFNSRSYTSLPGKMTSIFNHSKLPCHSEKLKASSWVINFIKKPHTKLPGKNVVTEKFLCIVRSTQSTQHVKCSACFLGLFLSPIVECTMSNDTSVRSIISTKEKR